MSEKSCDRCQVQSAMRGERFCKQCKKEVLAELKESGYLTRGVYGGRFRGTDARENTRETKYGKDQG